MPENARNKIIGFIEDGLLDWEMVCRECLQRMSCDEIDDMIRECNWDDSNPFVVSEDGSLSTVQV